MFNLKAFVTGAALMAASVSGAHAGMVVLERDGMGTGEFEFSFSSNAPRFVGALLEFGDYDRLGVSVTDGTDTVLPLVETEPGESILFGFGAGQSGNYVVNVSGLGDDGLFGIKIEAVPLPGAALLLVSALGVGGLLARRRRSSAI